MSKQGLITSDTFRDSLRTIKGGLVIKNGKALIFLDIFLLGPLLPGRKIWIHSQEIVLFLFPVLIRENFKGHMTYGVTHYIFKSFQDFLPLCSLEE